MDKVVLVQALFQYTFTPIVLNDPELGTDRFVANKPDTTAAKTMPIDATARTPPTATFCRDMSFPNSSKS
jgi:hypothetical protein